MVPVYCPPFCSNFKRSVDDASIMIVASRPFICGRNSFGHPTAPSAPSAPQPTDNSPRYTPRNPLAPNCSRHPAKYPILQFPPQSTPSPSPHTPPRNGTHPASPRAQSNSRPNPPSPRHSPATHSASNNPRLPPLHVHHSKTPAKIFLPLHHRDESESAPPSNSRHHPMNETRARRP